MGKWESVYDVLLANIVGFYVFLLLILTVNIMSCLIGLCYKKNKKRVLAENSEKRYLKQDKGFTTICLLYTSDAADDTPCVDLGGRRIIKKKKNGESTTT
eukprot:TRINITY_DN15762_c0_g1_i2.p3 TRINITY_DN15762_c0_g1~~TRINITY_DN15762_c0_g1_i2.p3  ORF type:complete len:100 (+),score=15.19 TRINITY_DN15762_c0_g1_i2:159-458(+)